ncbi:MAG: hypothetical protein NC389_09820 [Acetatifactor muris]|nr:hypothetical protein [Acetatifactor muris]
MRGKREAEILAGTFRDQLTVYRKERAKDPETLQTLEKDVLIYEKIPCALSRGSSGRPDRQEFHSEKQFEAVIFTMPGAEMKDNDRAEIITEAGQAFKGITGKTFGYISHGETPFAAEELT